MRGAAGVYGTLDSEHKASTASGTSGLTLLRLRAWMQEPMERMCLMAKLVDAAGPFTGGALASRLHAYGRHGDPATRALVQRIMDGVCAPLYSMMTRYANWRPNILVRDHRCALHCLFCAESLVHGYLLRFIVWNRLMILCFSASVFCFCESII